MFSMYNEYIILFHIVSQYNHFCIPIFFFIFTSISGCKFVQPLVVGRFPKLIIVSLYNFWLQCFYKNFHNKYCTTSSYNFVRLLIVILGNFWFHSFIVIYIKCQIIDVSNIKSIKLK